MAKDVDASWYVWWLFLAFNLTTSGMKHYSEMEGTSARNCLLGLKGLNSLSSRPLRQEGTSLIRILRREDTPLIWATPAGSLHKGMEEGSFCTLPACSYLVSKSVSSLALGPTSLGF